MEPIKEQIRQIAVCYGADDVRFAAADRFEHIADAPSPRALLADAASIIVLFVRYLPAATAQAGHIALSAYYIASHKAYMAAKKLTAYLRENGKGAVHAPSLPAKAAALRTGGSLGDNGFYYHPQYGSFVSIQTVVTNAAEPDVLDEKDISTGQCQHCGACKRACPSGAVDDIQNCLRYHLYDTVLKHMRGDVYQLLGCEKCQSACPLNLRASSLPHAYPVDALLRGEYLAELKALAGTNFVRKQRILSQATLYAANTGAVHLIEHLKKLYETAPPHVREHARWALEKLKAERQSK